MASFLPPISDQIWNEELLWLIFIMQSLQEITTIYRYPVPFRSEEIIDHASFGKL